MGKGNKGIWYDLGLDNKRLKRDAAAAKNEFKGISKQVERESSAMDRSFNSITKSLAAVFSIAAAGSFIKKVAMVRGEFQQLEVAFKTMLGSKAKADKLMARTIDFAAKTPFDLQGVAQGTKQLLAYGSEAETVTDELSMLGNIASGLSIPLGDIVYLYGTTRTQGQLFTRDLRQFMGRGIPLAAELAKQFNTNEKGVNQLVTAGRIGFKEVEIAMRSMTAEGGKFYNLMEEQSKTITGKISNLGDGVSQMFNKIGQSHEGAMGAVLDTTIDLVDNYEEVGKMIAELIALYGTYRAALILAATANTLATEASLGFSAAQMTQYRWTLLTTKATKLLNASMLANPYVLVAAAITGVVFAIYKFFTAATEEEKARERLNDQLRERAELIEGEKNQITSLIGIIQDEVTTLTQKHTALEKLKVINKDIFTDLDIEGVKTLNLTELKKKLNLEYEREERLNKEKQISDNDKEIASLQKLHKGLTSREDAGSRLVTMNKITNLREVNRLLKEGFELEKKAAADAKKAAEKAKIDAAEKLKNAPLRNRADILKEILDLETKIGLLRDKGVKGLTEKEQTELQNSVKDLSGKKQELTLFTGKKAVKTKEVTVEETLNQELDNSRKIEDAKYESEIKRLEIQKDGSKKSLELLKVEGDRKLVVLQRQKADEIKALEEQATVDKKKHPSKENAEAWKDKIKEFENTWDTTIKHQATANKNASKAYIDGLLAEYQTYEEKVSALKKEAANKVADLEFLGEKAGNKDKYSGKIKLIGKELKKALFELEKLSNKSIISKLFADTRNQSIKALKSLITEAEKLYKGIPKTDENVEKLKAIRDQIDKLKDQVHEADTGFRKMADGLKELFAGGKAEESIGKIKEGFEEASKYVDFFKDSLSSIGEALGSEALQDIAAGIEDVMKVADNTFKGAELGAQLGGGVGAIVGGAIGFLSGLADVIGGNKDKRREREIQRLQKQVDQLKKSYDSLGRSIEKAYSADASKLIQQQDENLRKQKSVLEDQIKQEESKKKSDQGKIDQWKDAIYQIDQALLDTESRQIEAINGKGVQDAIADFSSAYIDAWSSGEDKAKAMKGVVRDMVKSAITELVKSRMSGEVEAFSSYLASAMSDGILSAAEKNVLDSLEQAITNKMSGLSSTLDDYMIDDDGIKERQAAEKGFSSMSQDSADELNGRFATLQAHTFMIAESIKIIETGGAVQLQHLAGIEANTASLSRLAQMETDIGSMKAGIDSINDNGIKLKK